MCTLAKLAVHIGCNTHNNMYNSGYLHDNIGEFSLSCYFKIDQQSVRSIPFYLLSCFKHNTTIIPLPPHPTPSYSTQRKFQCQKTSHILQLSVLSTPDIDNHLLQYTITFMVLGRGFHHHKNCFALHQTLQCWLIVSRKLYKII